MVFAIERLQDYIKEKNVEALKFLKEQYGLIIENGKLKMRDKTEAKNLNEFWDQRQFARKILLNSLNIWTLG